MALLHSLEKQGNFLFRYRSYLPLILFIPAFPVVYFSTLNETTCGCHFYYSLIAVAMSLLGIVIRAIAIATTPKGTSGRNTEKQVAESLNSSGIYSTVRHPLYLGNFFMWMGIVAFTFNIWFFLVVSLAFWLYYERIMFAEERFLERKFGEAYLTWSLTAPAFIPSFKNYRKSETPFSWKSIFRREYSGWLATALCFMIIDQFRFFIQTKTFDFNSLSMYALIIVFVITMSIRTLKHSTRLLHEDDRS
jgi:protein-S-isoprenylcysteine O-methyltransferase Ste14